MAPHPLRARCWVSRPPTSSCLQRWPDTSHAQYRDPYSSHRLASFFYFPRSPQIPIKKKPLSSLNLRAKTEEAPRSLTLLNAGGQHWYEKCSKNKALLSYSHVTIVIAGMLLPSICALQDKLKYFGSQRTLGCRQKLFCFSSASTALQHECTYECTRTSTFMVSSHKSSG